jgi:transposase
VPAARAGVRVGLGVRHSVQPGGQEGEDGSGCVGGRHVTAVFEPPERGRPHRSSEGSCDLDPYARTDAPPASYTLTNPRLHRRLRRALFTVYEHVEVEATWAIYQRMIAAYREPDRTKGRQLMTRLIASISHDVPAVLSEVITLRRTLKNRAADVLAYFDRPQTSNGPTEAIGRLEHLRGTALGFRSYPK